MINTVASVVVSGGWIETTLGKLAEYITSGSRDWSRYYADAGAIFIRTQDINQNRLSLEEVAFVKLPEMVEGKRSLVRKGDLLVTITGANVGKVAVVEGEIPEAYVSQSVCLVRLKDPSLAKFIHLQLTAKRGDKTTVESMAYGLGRPVLNLDNIRSAPIRVAPAKVQVVIVAEIEKQFSRLDEAVANLKRVKANLKRYKASVLKAAVEGKLTEDWRKQHPDAEPASKLLERILVERQGKWEGRGQCKEPFEVNMSEPPVLAIGWMWTTIDALTITGPQNGLYLPQSLYGDGIPILRIDDFQDGWSRASDELQKVRASPAQVRAYCLDDGDFVINRVNSPTHLGKALVVQQKHLPAIFESNMMRLRLSSHIQTPFIALYLQSIDGRRRLTKNAKWAVNQASINQVDVGMTELPLPPFKEQQCIVNEVERRLSVIDELEAAVEVNLTRADRLRQSILSQTFSGRLLLGQRNEEQPTTGSLSR